MPCSKLQQARDSQEERLPGVLCSAYGIPAFVCLFRPVLVQRIRQRILILRLSDSSLQSLVSSSVSNINLKSPPAIQHNKLLVFPAFPAPLSIFVSSKKDSTILELQRPFFEPLQYSPPPCGHIPCKLPAKWTPKTDPFRPSLLFRFSSPSSFTRSSSVVADHGSPTTPATTHCRRLVIAPPLVSFFLWVASYFGSRGL
ncbi:hypothetical protein B0T20DRAFT_133072 [Sordaria brevicollis]|uniref:Uncharacterized protein n=1 Tax=Sordaria brevicollis TaxID=83679 RepID=A0AAE0PLM6_SORBR|nr:hypothetical protein B0T20DRAFT_133072 [Sordaria brevicollis]